MRFQPEALRRERTIGGYSARALARRAKVTAATITRAEAGETHPSPATVKALADALGVDVADLYDMEAA